MNNLQEFLHSLPPASENNARTIVKSKLQRFHRFPSEIAAREVERITHGELEADFDESWGNEPKKNYKTSIPTKLEYSDNIY